MHARGDVRGMRIFALLPRRKVVLRFSSMHAVKDALEDENTLSLAAESHPDVWEWAAANGCPTHYHEW